MIRILSLVAALARRLSFRLLAAPAFAQAPKLPAGTDPQNTLVIDTTKGRIVIKLRTDLAPKHAERLKLLAREGFYDNVPFHRVIAGFMAQTGDGAERQRHRRFEISEPEGRVHADAVQARHRRHGARRRPELRQLAVLHHASPTRRSSTASTP